MTNANETVSDVTQVSFYEGEAQFPDDFASQGPCEWNFGVVNTRMFENSGCGNGGDGVNTAIKEACPVCKGNGHHFSERGYVVI